MGIYKTLLTVVYTAIMLVTVCNYALAEESKSEESFYDGIIEWQSTNIQLLRGERYKLGSEERTIITLEHANRWKYGDFHIFADHIMQDSGRNVTYVEATPRLSLSKVTGADFSYGIIKDVLISGNFEKPQNRETRFLGGFSVDLDLPGFKFFKTNFWRRNNQELDGHTYQATLAWNYPFEFEGNNFLIEGFADFAGSEGTTTAHQLIVPRFLLDISGLVGLESNNLWAGMEYSYWHNKFGVDGVTESVPQMQIKWVF